MAKNGYDHLDSLVSREFFRLFIAPFQAISMEDGSIRVEHPLPLSGPMVSRISAAGRFSLGESYREATGCRLRRFPMPRRAG